MDQKLVVNGGTGEPAVFKYRLLVPEEETGSAGKISTIASYRANLYIGTTTGQLLHYHHFEDAAEYMLILNLQLSDSSRVITKILILPNTERALVLIGSTASVYSLPELSPCHIGKLKDINDLLMLAYSAISNDSRLQKSVAVNDKIVAFTSSKIRIIQIDKDQIKLLKDINYSGAVSGISTASRMSSNYSNLVLVANPSNYDIIDLKMTRKIPLFDYTGNRTNVPPHMVSYDAMDKEGAEEYLLTIKNDENTSLAMFINSLGDVTRGTLTWIGEGYPVGGIVVRWPYVFGVFASSDHSNKLIVSSLESLQVLNVVSLEEIFYGRKSTKQVVDEIETELKGEETDNKQKEVKDIAQEENLTQQDIDKDNLLQQENQQEQESGEDTEQHRQEQPFSLDSINLTISEQSEIFVEKPSTESAQLLETIKDINISTVSDILVENQTVDGLLSKVNLMNGSRSSSIAKHFDIGNIILHDDSKVWILYSESVLIQLQDSFIFAMQEGTIKSFSEELEGIVDTYEGEIHQYILYMLVLSLIEIEDEQKILKYVLRLKNGHLVVDPLFIIYMLSDFKEIDTSHFDFSVYSGIREIMEQCKPSSSRRLLLLKYFDSVYPDLVQTNSQTQDIIRRAYYALFKLNEESIFFFQGKDKMNWSTFSHINSSIIDLWYSKGFIKTILQAYRSLKAADEEKEKEISEKLCTLVIQLLSQEKGDSDISTELLVADTLADIKANPPDPSLYTKYLIEILKVDKIRGFEFMKKNNKQQYRSVHKTIMDEISETYASESDFSLLKIEFLESTLRENKFKASLQDELAFEMAKLMSSSEFLVEEYRINFDILVQTYKIENSLTDSKWPKISWVDFLHLNSKSSECKDFVDIYLKVYELLLVSTDLKKSTPILSELILNDELFSYYKFVNPDDTTVRLLLDYSDFESAEFVAVHRKLPFPKFHFYIENDSRRFDIVAPSRIRDDLFTILKYYLKEITSDPLCIFAIRHFISSFGNSFFTPSEILSYLPDHIPIAYLMDYLTEVIIDLQAANREVQLRKSISKADATFTKSVYKNFANSFENGT